MSNAEREPRNRPEQRRFDRLFASGLMDERDNYAMVCHDCGTCVYRQRDSKYVKLARSDDETLPCSCDGEYVLVVDAKSDE